MKALIIVIAALLLGAFGLLSYLDRPESFELTVNFKNSKAVELYDKNVTMGEGDKKLVAKIVNSGQAEKVEKGHEYIVVYKAADGFESGDIEVPAIFDDKEVTVNPFYSQSRLKPLVEKEIPLINQAFRQKYPGVNTYRLQPGKLYGRGDYYGASLKYVSNDTFNDDLLRVVFQKENGIWKVKTVPDITLSKYTYPDIPHSILKDVNASFRN